MDDEIRRLYVTRKLSLRKVAARLDISMGMVRRRLKAMKIQSRSPLEAQLLSPRRSGERNLTQLHRTMLKALDEFGELTPPEKQRVQVLLALDDGIAPRQLAVPFGISAKHVYGIWRYYKKRGLNAICHGHSKDGQAY